MTQLRINNSLVTLPASVDFAVTPGCRYAIVKIELNDESRLLEVEAPPGADEFTLDFHSENDQLIVHGPERRTIFHVENGLHTCPTVNTKLPQVGLALLIDSTMAINYRKDQNTKAKPHHYYKSSQWQTLKPELEKCYELTGATEVRSAVIQFGDVDDDKSNFQPTVTPEDPIWQRYDGADVSRQLDNAIELDGGDFIDAVAEGLQSCQALKRHQQTNVVILVGNSLGYMVVDHTCPDDRDQARIDQALLTRANRQQRRLDVYSTAEALKEAGFIIVTIFEDAHSNLHEKSTPDRDALLKKAAVQYRQLASVPSLSFRASSFTAQKFADAFSKLPDELGTQFAWATPIGLDDMPDVTDLGHIVTTEFGSH